MTTEIQLNKIRNEAFGKLKNERMKFDFDEMFRIVEIIRNYRATHRILSEKDFSGVTKQIRNDIIMYKKYDCLAMWLDGQGGLAKHEPELIVRIAKEVGGLKEE